jgi:hypothetical protein
MDANRMINGILRAIRLDASFYNEVEADPSYQREALGVVGLVAVLGAIGAFLSGLIQGHMAAAIGGLIFSFFVVLIGYFIWSFVAHWVGTQFFKGQGDLGEVQRALGFAYSPQLLNFFTFIPCLGGLIGLVAWILSLATGFVAIRESLDQDNTNALLTMVVATIIMIVITAIAGAIAGILGFTGAAIAGAFRP